MSKKSWVVIAVVAVAGTVGFLFFRRQQKSPEIETAIVSRGDLVQSIFASGEIRAENQRELTFGGSSAKVVVVSVSEGDQVVQGQLLAVLDQRELKESLHQAEISLEKARADLDYYGETRRLFREEHKYDGPSENIFAQFGQQDAKVRGAEKAVERYNSQVESARLALEKSSLVSPIAGTVVEVNVKEGELFSSSQPAIVVADLSEIIFEAEVDESEIERIEVGQRARVSLDAYSDIGFEGWVSKIAKVTTLDSGGDKIVEVEIGLKRISEDKGGLYLGLSGDAEIIFEEKKDILRVSLDAVVSENGEDFVFVVEGEGVVRRRVELGLENEDLVEVVGGLREGEEVATERLEGAKKRDRSAPRLRFLGK